MKKQSYSKLGWIWWWSHIQSRVATRLQSDMEEMKNKRGYLVTGVWPTSEKTATIRSSKEGWGWNKLPELALFISFPLPHQSSVIRAILPSCVCGPCSPWLGFGFRLDHLLIGLGLPLDSSWIYIGAVHVLLGHMAWIGFGLKLDQDWTIFWLRLD